MIPPTRPLSDRMATPDPNDEDAITEEQMARLRQLCDELGEPFDGNLTYSQAARRIAALEEIKEG